MRNKILILGSCVSRDVFELAEKNEYKILSYLARTSFASAFHNIKTTDIDTSSIKSAFQKRMVDCDLFKNTSQTILENDFDWLIIDLIDERFDIFISESNEVFTLSSEFKDNCTHSKQGLILHPNSMEFFEKWKLGWDNFISLAKEHNFLNKIVLNKVFWTNITTDGKNVVKDNYQSWIDNNNLWLSRLYDYIEKKSEINIIEPPISILIADNEHKWGLQPYHYSRTVYLYLLDGLRGLNDVDMNFRINNLPIYTENITIKNPNQKDFKPIVFYGDKNKDCQISIDVLLASDDKVKERELLYTVKYDCDNKDLYTKQGFVLSGSKEIGYFKYLVTIPLSVYRHKINLIIPKNEKVSFLLQSFYPEGKTVILNTLITKKDETVFN